VVRKRNRDLAYVTNINLNSVSVIDMTTNRTVFSKVFHNVFDGPSLNNAAVNIDKRSREITALYAPCSSHVNDKSFVASGALISLTNSPSSECSNANVRIRTSPNPHRSELSSRRDAP
jgi:hypothetical protein